MKYKFNRKKWIKDVLSVLMLALFNLLFYGILAAIISFSPTIKPIINSPWLDIIFTFLSLGIPSMLALIYYAYSTRNQLTATIAGFFMHTGVYVLIVSIVVILTKESIDITNLTGLIFFLPVSIGQGALGYASAARMPKYIIAILIIIQIITAFETMSIMIFHEIYPV